MNPNDQLPPTPDYSFITNSPQPNRGLSSYSPKKRLLLVAAFLGILLVIMLVFFNVIRSNNSGGKDQLVDLAAYQTELIRVATLASNNASGQTKAVAQTALLTFQTDLNTTYSIAKKQGVKIDEKKLVIYKSSKTDELLEQAKKTNQYNDAYQKLFAEQLTGYTKKLRAAFDAQKSKSARTSISSINQAALLLSFDYTPPTSD